MKNAKKLMAFLLVAAMCCCLFIGCGGKKDGGNETAGSEANDTNNVSESTGNDTLVAADTGFESKFSPFFAASAADQGIVDLTQIYMMYTDRVSNPVLKGIEGETREYNGNEYTYTGPADITVTENTDGTVYYDIKMRDDIKFSDGTGADIDDFIFSLYVLLDPSYDGSSTLYSSPIEGLEEYRSGMDTLFNLLVAAGRDNTDYTYWTEDQQKAFWEDLDQAGAAFAQEIVDYCVAGGYNEEGD
ncbi:MAG: ABC transporter substrate-binding protein, partial [Lachnospiraceae bacterium]